MIQILKCCDIRHVLNIETDHAAQGGNGNDSEMINYQSNIQCSSKETNHVNEFQGNNLPITNDHISPSSNIQRKSNSGKDSAPIMG